MRNYDLIFDHLKSICVTQHNEAESLSSQGKYDELLNNCRDIISVKHFEIELESTEIEDLNKQLNELIANKTPMDYSYNLETVGENNRMIISHLQFYIFSIKQLRMMCKSKAEKYVKIYESGDIEHPKYDLVSQLLTELKQQS